MKILIWGTGIYSSEFINLRLDINQINAFIDNNNSKQMFMGKPVISPEQLNDYKFDLIIVATGYAKEIYEQCNEIGVDLNKVFFLINNYIVNDMNQDYSKAEKILGTEYANVIKNMNHVIRMEYDEIIPLASSGYRQTAMYINDFVRIRNFELVVEEILRNKINGSVAEYGVFRGEFAKYINGFFADRKCYLFDTFEGFNINEAKKEKKKKTVMMRSLNILKTQQLKESWD